MEDKLEKIFADHILNAFESINNWLKGARENDINIAIRVDDNSITGPGAIIYYFDENARFFLERVSKK